MRIENEDRSGRGIDQDLLGVGQVGVVQYLVGQSVGPVRTRYDAGSPVFRGKVVEQPNGVTYLVGPVDNGILIIYVQFLKAFAGLAAR